MYHTSHATRCLVLAAGFFAAVSFSGCSSPARSVVSSRPHAPSTSLAEDPSAPAANDVYGRRVAEYEADPACSTSHPRRILYADALLHLGRTRKAIQVLADTEIAFPEAYVNAIYLGLAYEMAGDLKSARFWVARSIERNADARCGSEWLHLAMIEARLAVAKDPNWLQSHSVLADNTHRTAEEILSAIKIQLAVRGDFGLSTDAVVCDLYFEAGICAPNYAQRQEYFAQSLELGTLRRAEIEQHEKVRAKAHASAQLN